MGGDGDTSVRVKFKFEAECKVAKLESIHLTSMESLRKLIFKRFPTIQGMVERPQTTGGIAPTHTLSLSCKDMAGDYITVDDDDDLDAMDILNYRNLDFCVNVIPRPLAAPSRSSNAERWGKISTASAASNDRWGKLSDPTKLAESMPSNSRSNSDRWGKLSDHQLSSFERAAEAGGNKMRQCRYFQSGFCKHGESCHLVHDRTKRAESLPSPIVVDWSGLSPYLPIVSPTAKRHSKEEEFLKRFLYTRNTIHSKPLNPH